jgi:hypothetical protein
VQWHVEDNTNDNKYRILPFTRGISFYKITNYHDKNHLKIYDGIDFVEPFLKIGPLTLFLTSLQRKLQLEPIRYIPLAVWILYMYIVFFSNGIIPGADVLQLEQRTWDEVRDLSLNFFLVAPIMKLSFSPIVHPLLESVFNVLLSWAAMFIGYISDDRTKKPNLIPIVPVVIGMQFLTSAFLLPYLITRTSELDKEQIHTTIQRLEDDVEGNNTVSTTTQTTTATTATSSSTIGFAIGENKFLGPILGLVGTYSIIWGLYGRYDDYGTISERYISFVQLLSIDRVGSSFLIDLFIFGIFQGWLVDDDLKRRRIVQHQQQQYDCTLEVLRFVAKYIPFFGMAIYLTFRPNLASSIDTAKYKQ